MRPILDVPVSSHERKERSGVCLSWREVGDCVASDRRLLDGLAPAQTPDHFAYLHDLVEARECGVLVQQLTGLYRVCCQTAMRLLAEGERIMDRGVVFEAELGVSVESQLVFFSLNT